MPIPYTFAPQVGPIPLAEIDANFAYVGTASGTVFTAPEAGGVPISVNTKAAQILSPIDFGADPTGVADSTTAFTNFLNAIQAQGVIGQMPNGTFSVSSGFTVTAAITLLGSNQTVISNTSAALAAPVIHITSTGGSGSRLANFAISTVAVTSTSAHGVQLDGGTDFSLDNIHVSGTYYGIYVPNGQSGAYISSCFVQNTVSHGFVVDAGNLTIDNCYAINCGGDGFSFTTVSAASAGLLVSNCTNYNSGNYGFAFQGSSTNAITDLLLINNVNSVSAHNHGFLFDTFGKNITVTGCFSEEAGVNASLVFVSASHGMRFTANNHRVVVSACQCTFSGASGLAMECGYFSVNGGDYTANNIGADGSDSGILVGAAGAVTEFSITGANTVPKPSVDANTQQYGICIFSAGSTNGAIVGCPVSGLSGPIFVTGSPSVKVTNCPGYANESLGIATINSGSSSVTVTHNLSSTPTVVLVNPSNANIAPLGFWSGNYNATTFTINTSGNVGSNTNFCYDARF